MYVRFLRSIEIRGNGCAGIGRKIESPVVEVGVGVDIMEDAVDVFDGLALFLVGVGSAEPKITDAGGAPEEKMAAQTERRVIYTLNNVSYVFIFYILNFNILD